MTRGSEFKGTAIIIVVAFITGLNIFLVKIGTTFVSQLPLTSMTLILAGLIVLTTSILSGKFSKIISCGRSNIPKILWIGILGASVPITLIAYGLSFSKVSNSFLLQVEVIYSMIFSYVLLKEKISRKQIIFSIFSIIGVILVLTEGVVRAVNIGDIFLLLSPLFLQLAHIVAKNLMNKCDPIVVTMYRQLIGGLTLLVVSLLLGWNLLEFRMVIEGTSIVFSLGFGYAVGMSLLYYGVKYINLSKVTSIIIMHPVISSILAVLLLGETLSTVKILGIFIVFFSTLKLSQIRSIKRN